METKEISPVFKRDRRLIKTKYRPLTILPSLYKVFVHSRIRANFGDIFQEYMIAHRKFHGSDTALLSLTEQWKTESENHSIISLVSMALSKAFDTLPHDLKVEKFRA